MYLGISLQKYLSSGKKWFGDWRKMLQYSGLSTIHRTDLDPGLEIVLASDVTQSSPTHQLQKFGRDLAPIDQKVDVL